MNIKVNTSSHAKDEDRYVNGGDLIDMSCADGIYAFVKVRENAGRTDERVARGKTFVIISLDIADEAIVIHNGVMTEYYRCEIIIGDDDLFEKVDGTLTLDVDLR